MTCCDDMHTRFGKYGNGDVQVGELPAEMNVKGKVAWYVYKGPYANLPGGWDAFWKKYAGKGLKCDGHPEMCMSARLNVTGKAIRQRC